MLEIEEFLSSPGLLYDIRSPGEFLQGTLPGALNLPLFSNEERSAVGTSYKKESPQAAFLLGLEYVGPKMRGFVEKAQGNKTPRLFCWRGGMRSQSMGWLFSQAGMKPLLLKGGYKAFRAFTLKTLEKTYPLQVLGGLTGSGKTSLLRSLKTQGMQILDLEELSCHRGSVFGKIEGVIQPTNEHFENLIAIELWKMDPLKPIWVEDESRMIGSCKIPDPIYKQMLSAPFNLLQTPIKERLELLIEEYGSHTQTYLKEAVLCIKKRLGGARTELILQCIEAQDLKKAARLLLEYYDQAYMYNIKRSQRSPLIYETATVHGKIP
jgi:tRNA 2-selenouridine synthase